MNQLLEAALKYHSMGFCVIPVNPSVKDGIGKKPYIKWADYQTRMSTEEEIRGWWGEWPEAMIGIVTGPISDITSLDADTPEAMQKVEDLITDSYELPTSRTPGGGGHFHVRYVQGSRNSNDGLVHVRSEGGYIIFPPSRREDGKRYTWQCEISEQGLPEPCDAIRSYINSLALGGYKGGDKTEIRRMFTKGSRDEDLFHVANQLVKSSTEENVIRQVLENLALICKPPFPENEIPAKIQSAIQRAERKERNLSEDIREWVMSSSGVFLSSDVVTCLHLSSREEGKNASKVLERLKDEGIIEKYGDKRGSFRVVESSCEKIDFMNVKDKVVDLRWPFDIERWVKILPKNIIVIAGEQNAGKTAFLLNTCFLNMGEFKINYFSSEMGAMELQDRLNKFECNLQHWDENINFRERSSNFADVIKPNDVNIIDFLEITDEFYKVGGMIKEIYDKLKKGVALIALQKNKGTDLGLGGARSIEKARLYLSIGDGHLKIVKGKNWATEHNPNNMEWKFKLLQGSKFIWGHEE
jgi:hypothetical protein